jgi:hypothetical protein
MSRQVKVYEIKAVRLTRYRSVPPKLQIDVDATTRTSGYTDPQLVEYIYVHPPLDGVYDFDFIATSPSTVSSDVISPISLSYIMEPMHGDLKGVRIHATNNSLEQLLGEGGNASGICVRGRLTDEGVECQALRSTTGELYTLVGDLNGFKNGDEVVVSGTIAGISFCMQGTTINVSWIGAEVPRAL